MKKHFGKESVCWWYPKVKLLGIPQPKTSIIKVDHNRIAEFAYLNKQFPKSLVKCIHQKAGLLGYPVFLRSDITSYKQAWKKTCFVKRESELLRNLRNLLKYSLLVGDCAFRTNAVIIREYIPLSSYFSCYSGKCPVSTEMRYFINSCKILCRHPYWTEEMVKQPNSANWKQLLRKTNTVTIDELLLLDTYAKRLASYFADEDLAVDFVKSKQAKWYLIDIGPAKLSYRPDPNCPRCSKYQ